MTNPDLSLDLTRYATGGSSDYSVLINLLVIIAFTVVFWVVAVSLHSSTLPRRV